MDFKSLLIGFLLAACLFLLMGSTPMRFTSAQGRYQVSAAQDKVVILDTQTGEASVIQGDSIRFVRYGK